MVYFRLLGRLALRFFLYLGELAGLVGQVCESLLRGKRRWRQFFEQIVEIGYRSQIVVIITGGFTGAVLAAQALFQFALVDMETMGGVIVSIGMMRELGPTITGLMLAGRVGSSMAAEIGTMKVSEEIDALEIMGIDPARFLVLPRLIAMAVFTPLLTVYTSLIGIMGGAMTSLYQYGVSLQRFHTDAIQHLTTKDVYTGLLKAFIFGIVIAIVGCSQGLRAKGGAIGVGHATRRAVVVSYLLVIILGYYITFIFFRFDW